MYRRSIKKRNRLQFTSRSGQATSEYILLLAMIVVLVLLLANKFIRPMAERLTNVISQQMEKTLFGRDLHRLTIRR